jgi:hypothetical protein
MPKRLQAEGVFSIPSPLLLHPLNFTMHTHNTASHRGNGLEHEQLAHFIRNAVLHTICRITLTSPDGP